MSKCEPYANQAKELTAAASVAVKMVRTMSNKTNFRWGVVRTRTAIIRHLIIDFCLCKRGIKRS